MSGGAKIYKNIKNKETKFACEVQSVCASLFPLPAFNERKALTISSTLSLYTALSFE